jgi:hypothetical protein
MVVKYQVDPDKRLAKALNKAIKEVDDLTIPLIVITKSWYQGNKAIFTLKGPGKYADYKIAKGKSYSPYARAKAKATGSAYPIHLGFIGRKRKLRDSLTIETDANAVKQIVNKKALILGTKVPYAVYAQLGTKHMPQRPVLFIGGEQTAPPALNNRRQAWIEAINDYVIQVSKQVGKVTR